MREFVPKTEEKWKKNREKVAFLRNFPGMLSSPEEAEEKTVELVRILDSGMTAIMFDDGTFLLTGKQSGEPSGIAEGIEALREQIGEVYPDALATLDRLTKEDGHLKHLARKEKLLGAIQNNIAQYPELFDEIPALLERLRNQPTHGEGTEGGDDE